MAPNGKRYRKNSNYQRTHNGEKSKLDQWANIIPDLLIQIMMHLELVDYFSFSRVCKSWRSVARDCRNIFLSCKEPLLLTFSPRAKRSFSVNNVFSGYENKMMLPSFSGKRCVGVSGGYLIMLDKKTGAIWLVNFITRNELYFPALPDKKSMDFFYTFRTILVHSTLLSQSVLVVLFPREKHIIFSAAGSASWNTIFPQLKPDSAILDIVALKGKIYFIDRFGRIGEMSLYPSVILRMLDISNIPMNIPPLCSYLIELVSSSERLFLVQMEPSRVLELDIEGLQWVERKDLCGDALFLDCGFKGSAVVYPSKWANHGNAQKDTIHYLASPSGFIQSTSVSGEDRSVHKAPVPSSSFVWFFPHESFHTNVLDRS